MNASYGLQFLRLYALLVGTYVFAGVLLALLTRQSTMQRRRIRPSAGPPRPGATARDVRRSFRNLAVLAAYLTGARILQDYEFGFAAPRPSLATVPLTFIGSMIIFDTWFYWIHRLLHTKALFRRVHRQHHLSRHPTAWANNNDAVADTALSHLYWLIAPLLLPMHPSVLLAHKLFEQFAGGVGHCGHETPGAVDQRWSPLTTVTHHDLHHEMFNGNYGIHFVFWDRWMGTESPTYSATLAAVVAERPLCSAQAFRAACVGDQFEQAVHR